MARADRQDRSNREQKEDPELIEKLVGINRVAKVVKGGRRFGFAALVVVGDGRGRVGHGAGKAREVPEAIRKATEQAKRSMVRVPLREGRTLHHDIKGDYGAGHVILRSAPSGTGVIAGGSIRTVLELAGIKNVLAKRLGSKTPLNNARAAMVALSELRTHKATAKERGISLEQVYS